MAKQYWFRARNWQGKRVKGKIEAESEEIAVRELVFRGLFALDVRQARDADVSYTWLFGSRVRDREMAAFTRQFAAMMRSGLPLLDVLQVLESQAENRFLRQVLAGIMASVQRGLPLWQALSEHPAVFSRLFVQTVKAGEASGSLDTVLERLAAYLEREYRIKTRVRNSLVYPCFVAMFTLAVMMFLTGFVVPAFASVLAEAGLSLPLVTRVLLVVAGGARRHFLEILGLIPVVAVAVKAAATTAAGGMVIDRLKLSLPVAGRLNAKMISARFSRTLGLLVGSGVPVLPALEVAAQAAGNRVFEENIGAAVRGVERGGSLAHSLSSSGMFEPMVVQMVKVGEETGSLDRMLVKAAEYHELEAERTVDGLLSVFEPVLVLFMAGVVGAVVVGTLLPVFELITAFE